MCDPNATPQSLDDLTAQILLVPMVHFHVRVPQMIKDYLAQGFGAAYLDGSLTEAELERLRALFAHLTRRGV